MESTKKSVPSKKVTKKPLIGAAVKTKIILGAIIAFLVISVGGYVLYETGVPAKALTGATVAGERVAVNEMNYQFYKIFNMYYQYGLISSKNDLDAVYNSATGETYRDLFYNQAAKKMQSIILLNREAKNAGYKALSADKAADSYIDSMRTYASQKNTTADNILKSQYGVGATVRAVKSFIGRETASQEYAEYLKQTQYTISEEDMQKKYDASPADYDKVTFNVYYFASGAASDATDAEKATALTAAVDKAQGVVDAAKDPASFRDACAAAAPDTDKTNFDDNADPTTVEKQTKSAVTSSYSSDIADYLFADGRQAGDNTIIKTDSGAYAVYFQERALDETATVSYRIITLENSDEAKAHSTLDGYQADVTDEASFSNLAKKYSDASSAYAGGLVTGITEASLTSSTASDANTALLAWLFSADRKAGDMIIIEDDGSASLYYYQKSVPAWQDAMASDYADEQYNQWYDALAAEDGNGYTLNMRNIEFATY